MVTQKDNKTLMNINEKWNRFIKERKALNFAYSDKEPHWLTMLERENMLQTTLNILNKYRKTEKVYGID